MSVNNKTYNPAHSITMKAGEDIPAFRFVSHMGTLCDAETKSAGVSEVPWDTGEYAAIITLGTMPIETTTTIDVGEDVTSDADGKAKPAGIDMPVNGRALNSCSGAGFVTISLVP